MRTFSNVSSGNIDTHGCPLIGMCGCCWPAELAERGIRVNTLGPGPIATDFRGSTSPHPSARRGIGGSPMDGRRQGVFPSTSFG